MTVLYPDLCYNKVCYNVNGTAVHCKEICLLDMAPLVYNGMS